MAPLKPMGRAAPGAPGRRPGTAGQATPDYTIGCKRILLSSDYYPALQRPNVDLITDRITEIIQTGPVTADGTAHPADVIIYATGFKVIESVTALNVTGRDGRKLTPGGRGGLQRHHGGRDSRTSSCCSGPNTGWVTPRWCS